MSRGRLRTLAVAWLGSLLVTLPTAAVAAGFTDSVRAVSTVSTATVSAPTSMHCESVHLLELDMAWTSSPDAQQYVLRTPSGQEYTIAAPTTRYHVALVTIGTYTVRAVHPSGWASGSASVNVTIGVGGVALCS